MLKTEKLFKKLLLIDSMPRKGRQGEHYEELYPGMAKRYGGCAHGHGAYGVRIHARTNIYFFEDFPGNLFKHEKKLDPKILAKFERQGGQLGLSVSLQETGDGRYTYVEVSKQGYPASENASVVEQVEFLAKGIENAFKAQHE